jgi:hypothetical protein
MSTSRTHVWILLALSSIASTEAYAAGEKDEAIKYYREGKRAADLGEEVEKSNLPEAAMALYTEAIGKFTNAEGLFGKCPDNGCQKQRHEVRVELARVYLLAHRLYRAHFGGDAAVEATSSGPAENANLTIEDCVTLASSGPREDCERLWHAKILYESFRDARPAVTEKLLTVAATELPKIDAELHSYGAQIEHLKAKAAAEAKAKAEAEAKAKADAEAEANARRELDEQREEEREHAVKQWKAAEAAEADRLAKRSRAQMWAGTWLAIGGGTLAVVGIGVSLPFARAPQNAIDDSTWPATPHEAAALERNRHFMRVPYYSAWVTGAVGGAILLSGVALIVTTVVTKKKHEKAAASSSARLRPTLTGLEVRF